MADFLLQAFAAFMREIYRLRIYRCFCVGIALSITLALSGCADKGSDFRPMQGAAGNANSASPIRFSAPARAGGDLPAPEVVRRAASLSRQRHYPYFLLIAENDRQSPSVRPQVSVDYGRQPYGFGHSESGFGSGVGFSFSPSFFSRKKADSAQTGWLVYPLSRPDKTAVKALPLNKKALGKTALIYQTDEAARANVPKPLKIPLF